MAIFDEGSHMVYSHLAVLVFFSRSPLMRSRAQATVSLRRCYAQEDT
jgi:hypothetical protein